ncbi:MAG: hypothetical protein ABIJ53_07220, partial [Verrucomicrobiota bacterium]
KPTWRPYGKDPKPARIGRSIKPKDGRPFRFARTARASVCTSSIKPSAPNKELFLFAMDNL